MEDTHLTMNYCIAMLGNKIKMTYETCSRSACEFEIIDVTYSMAGFYDDGPILKSIPTCKTCAMFLDIIEEEIGKNK